MKLQKFYPFMSYSVANHWARAVALALGVCLAAGIHPLAGKVR